MKKLATYLYEIGQLKRVHRSGWWLIGIKNPETVAEHSFRTAVVAFVLAYLEKAPDPHKILVMSLFHDTVEARTNDLHGPGKAYAVTWDVVESEALKAQNANLPDDLSDRLNQSFEEFKRQSTLEAHIVHDADVLECLIQALEYQVQGYSNYDKVVSYCQKRLVTKAGKRLAKACISNTPLQWLPKAKAHVSGSSGQPEKPHPDRKRTGGIRQSRLPLETSADRQQNKSRLPRRKDGRHRLQ